MAGKEVKCTFNMEEEMHDWFQKVAFKIDCTKSEVIRCSLLLSLDTIANTPDLVNRIRFSDRRPSGV